VTLRSLAGAFPRARWVRAFNSLSASIMADDNHREPRSVFEAGINWRVVEAKWDGIREAFHGFDPAQVAAMPPAEIAAVENDARVIRNKAKIRATVQNAREVLAILDDYGSIRGYLASFPDAGAAAADMRRRFKFLGDTGVWRLLTSASRDIE
jgi:3-methyladenine DNA glycosylase Tag